MAYQEEAIEQSIDQLMELNREDSEEVELRDRTAENVTQTDADRERRERTSRRLTFGGGEYKTPAAAKAAAKSALNVITEQLQDIEATVVRDLANSKADSDAANGNRESEKPFWNDNSSQGSKGERGDRPSTDSPDPSSASDSDDFADMSNPIQMQDAILNTDTAGLPANIAMTPQAMLLGTVDLQDINPQFMKVGDNNCRSIKQAADWFRTNEPSTRDNPNQLDKLKNATKAGDLPAIKEI